MRLTVQNTRMAICHFPPSDPFPAWLQQASFFQMVRTAGELSIVCPEDVVPPDTASNGGWRILEVEGPLDFALTGVLNRITAPLAAARISLFAISTYLTDYVLVKEEQLERTLHVLQQSGWFIV
ncbi:MAG: ACT domain-containing protein [Saprospiraceae bacterium]